jgi:S1-C subfamily serine protease
VLRPFTFEERANWGQRAGALIVEAPHEGTPANLAGLRRGDVIVSFDGHIVDEPGDLYRLLKRSTIGQACQAEYVRDGEREATFVTPVERT